MEIWFFLFGKIIANRFNMKNTIISFSLIFFSAFTYSQVEPTIIEGEAQGTTYHITYYDKQNRNLQPEINVILADFESSVSTYISNSI